MRSVRLRKDAEGWVGEGSYVKGQKGWGGNSWGTRCGMCAAPQPWRVAYWDFCNFFFANMIAVHT